MAKVVSKALIALLACSGIGILLHRGLSSSAPSSSQPIPAAEPTLTQTSASGVALYVVRVPAGSSYKLKVAVADGVDSVKAFAERRTAIAAINAGFFDPVNRKTTSYLTVDQKLVGDPQQNERLTQNPKLQSYLKQIFNRSEFRQYRCAEKDRSAIAVHTDAVPQGCQLIHSVGAGPRLLPELTAVEEAFLDPKTNRDAIGVNQRNARSAIGITRDGEIILVMAAQKPEGISLPELAKVMKQLGAEQALNLDGGSSSALFYQGKTIYGKVGEDGKAVQRPVKSVLLVTK